MKFKSTQATRELDSLTFSQRQHVKVATVHEITKETPAYLIDKKMMLRLLSLFSPASFEDFKTNLAERIQAAQGMEEIKELMEEAVYLADFFNLGTVQEAQVEQNEVEKDIDISPLTNEFRDNRNEPKGAVSL